MSVLTHEFYVQAIEYAARYFLMFLCCITGSILRDVYTMSGKRKVHIKDAIVYSIPCTALLAMIYENIAYNLSIGIWVFVCVFAGLWSREIVALMLNNKVVLSGVKYLAKKAASKVIDMTGEDEEKLSEDLHHALDDSESDKPHNENIPDDNTKEGEK